MPCVMKRVVDFLFDYRRRNKEHVRESFMLGYHWLSNKVSEITRDTFLKRISLDNAVVCQ